MTHAQNVIYLLECGHKGNCAHCPTMATLHDLEVKSTDELNAYMVAPNRVKMWTVLGPEFGDDADKFSIIVRALECLMSSGA